MSPKKTHSRSKPHIKRAISIPPLSRSWLIFFGSLFLIVFGFNSPLFHLRYITCTFGGNPCSPEVRADLNRFLGTKTLTLSAVDIADYYQQIIPNANQVTARVQLPGTLHLELEPANTIAYFTTASHSAALIVSNEAEVIAMVEAISESDLPLVIDDSVIDLAVGEKITDTKLLFVIDLINELKTSLLPFDSIIVKDPETILVPLQSDRIAVFSSALEVSRQLTSLQLILTKAKIEPSQRFIDVRFDQPVLRSEL